MTERNADVAPSHGRKASYLLIKGIALTQKMLVD